MALEKYLRNLTEETENSEKKKDKKAIKRLYYYQNVHIWVRSFPLCKLVILSCDLEMNMTFAF